MTSPELQDEIDVLLFGYANIGSGFVHVYFDESLGRNTVQYVKAEDFIIPYASNNLYTCIRITKRVRKSFDEIAKLVAAGVYVDTGISNGYYGDNPSPVEQAKITIEGQSPSYTNSDAARLYETNVNLRLEWDSFKAPRGLKSPYVVTLDSVSNSVLAIRRNWRQEDPLRRKRDHFVKFVYVPGEGSMGLGQVQLTGQLSSTCTKTLRQLVDSGTLANLPGGLKSSAARIDSPGPVAPGTWKDVNLNPEDLAKAFVNLPYKEPSVVLLELLKLIAQQAQSFNSTADLDISASSQNAPVGTTLALIERQTEVSNAVQHRMHASMRILLRTIKDFLKEYEPEEYAKIFGPLDKLVDPELVEIHPSGDPSSSTMSQRVLQLDSLFQKAQMFPQDYDTSALNRAMVSAMGLPDADAIVPDKSKQVPEMALAQEQMALLGGNPVKAFKEQNHQAHLQAHGALLTDPMYQAQLEQNPKAKIIAAGIMAHMLEHYVFDYLEELEQQFGHPLPAPGQPLPKPIQDSLDELVAQAAQKVNQLHASQQHQIAAQQAAQDPMLALEQQKLQIEKESVDNKHQAAMAALASKHQLGEQKLQFDQAKLQTQQGKERADVQLHMFDTLASAHQQVSQQQADKEMQAADHDLEFSKTAVELGRMGLDHMHAVQQANKESLAQGGQLSYEAQQAELDRQHEIKKDVLGHIVSSVESHNQRQHEAEQAEADRAAQIEAAKNKPKPTGGK